MTHAAQFNAAVATFRAAFDTAFTEFRADRGANLVTLHALRVALPAYDGPAFNAGLLQLRRANLYVLETHESRHSRASAEMLAASIVEHGRRFVYVCRRDS